MGITEGRQADSLRNTEQQLWTDMKDYVHGVESKLIGDINDHLMALEDNLQHNLIALDARLKKVERMVEGEGGMKREEEGRKNNVLRTTEREEGVGSSFLASLELNIGLLTTLESRIESVLARVETAIQQIDQTPPTTTKDLQELSATQSVPEEEPSPPPVDPNAPLHTYSWGGNYDVNAYRRSASDINIKGQFI